MNAVKHGLYAESVVLSTESPEEYQETLDAYHQQFQPDGQAEFDLIEEMVAAKWRQRRLWAIESELVELEMLDQKEQLDEEYTSYTEITQLAFTYRALATSSTLPFLTRHESRLERAYSRALKNLLDLQRLRKATPPAPPKNMQERTQSRLRPTPTPAPAAQPPEGFPTTHTPQPTTGEATGRAPDFSTTHHLPPTPGPRSRPTTHHLPPTAGCRAAPQPTTYPPPPGGRAAPPPTTHLPPPAAKPPR